MTYYEVWVATPHYRGSKPLTYHWDGRLASGTVVAVELQSRPVPAVIVKKSSRPDFGTKPIVRVLSDTPLPRQQLALIEWLRDYYPAPMGNLLQVFLPGALLSSPRQKPAVKADQHLPGARQAPKLTPQQREAIEAIKQHTATTHLLHGDTGTGKTRVYSELAQDMLRQGLSSIIMTPEIGLTPQLADSLRDRCGDSVVVIHSMLAAAQRRDVWLRVLNSVGPLIVVGTRSALFSPVRRVGLIVMDEAHDFAYKQEQAPHYQTSRVAARLASLHGAKLVMGSATPSVSDYYALAAKKSPIIRMNQPAIAGTRSPQIELVNIKDRSCFTTSNHLSDALIKRVSAAIKSKEQSLIFLNRRGTARVTLCDHCGWQALCPNCATALTYHGDRHELLCHICAYKRGAITACQACDKPDVIYKSMGTKYLVEEVRRLFPRAKIQRFDTDNTRSERLERHYHDVLAGRIDILIGTQLLSKGLDLPRLSTVGIVLADTSLLIPDYTADEITYQQIYQLIGRVGRGHRGGHVVIQSYQPDNPVIQAAIKRDYSVFYERETKERRLFGFPPYRYLLKLGCQRASRASAEAAAQKIASAIKSGFPEVEVAGPSPAFHERVKHGYRWHIIVKARQRAALTAIIKSLPSGWSYDIDPVNLL